MRPPAEQNATHDELRRRLHCERNLETAHRHADALLSHIDLLTKAAVEKFCVNRALELRALRQRQIRSTSSRRRPC